MPTNFLRHRLLSASLLALGVFVAASSFQPKAFAQTNISGDIAGTVSDPSGATIVGASVTLTNKDTGARKTVSSGAHGEYRIPLLQPGDYDLSVAATGFQGAKTTITVQANQIASGDMKLTIGKATTVVNVEETQPLLHTEDAQISTSFSMEQIQALPNPGNDLTFIAQTSPGAVMNTQGGYGNFSVFGLPATSNTFTVNGGYYNDPFLNLNNSGATNLLLGNNDIADVTVTANAYDAAFGGLGGAQINEISRSGANGFHGNASYWWNGRAMNANDWFNNASTPLTPREFDNVNQWAGGVGGPIIKDKLFWFVNTEGLRVILPSRSIAYAPTPALQAAITSSDPAAAAAFPLTLPFGNLAGNGNSDEAAQYNTAFATFNNAPGINTAQVMPVCPPPSQPQIPNCTTYDAGSFEYFNGVATNFTHEWLITARVDYKIGANDSAFVHFEYDNGFQATYTSLLTPTFDSGSQQPENLAQFQETHTFTPNLTNQFLAAYEYYQAIFENFNAAAANALAPSTLVFFDSPLGAEPGSELLGGIDNDFPQGRNVTNYQFQDDLSWTKGSHTLKTGWTMRRDDVSDFDVNAGITPLQYSYIETWGAGYVDLSAQTFPTRYSDPIALYNMGGYVQDQWKARPNLTITAGLRLEHNSNPTCLVNCFGYSNGQFSTLSTSTTTPLNQLIASGQHTAFINLQKIGYEPRFGFAWLPNGLGSRTTVRGGFGLFVDTFPATVADGLLSNPPNSVGILFADGYFGGPIPPLNSSGPLLYSPSVAGNAQSAGAAEAAAIQAGFASGASTSTIGEPSLLTQAPKISYPTYEEYSLALEQQVSRTTALSLSYVGNHGYHEPVVSNSANACGFGNLPACSSMGSEGYNPNFTGTTVDYAGAISNYNGLIATVVNRQRYLTLQFNYAFSHAMDEISNGGFLPFGFNSGSPTSPTNLKYDYGNADYDVRNYISGSYVLTIPHFAGPRVLVDDWEVAGTVFHNTGNPFSVVDGYTASGITYYGGTLFAQQLGQIGPSLSKCGGNTHTNYGTPCAFANAGLSSIGLEYYDSATAFGQQERNQLVGPNYTDFDLDVTKGFKVPGLESGNLKLGAQFFNLFNHPNFAIPGFSTLGLGIYWGIGVRREHRPAEHANLDSWLGAGRRCGASPDPVQGRARVLARLDLFVWRPGFEPGRFCCWRAQD